MNYVRGGSYKYELSRANKITKFDITACLLDVIISKNTIEHAEYSTYYFMVPCFASSDVNYLKSKRREITARCGAAPQRAVCSGTKGLRASAQKGAQT